MINLELRDELVEEFAQQVEENAQKNLGELKLKDFMEDGNANLVRESVNKIKANVVAAIPEGIPVPKVSLYISPIGQESITLIKLSITNKIQSNKKFKFAFTATADNVVNKLKDFFLATYTELIVDEMIESNLEKVNEVLAEAVKKSGLSYEVSVDSPLGNAGKKVAYLSDDSVVFVADEDRAFDLDEILVLQEVDETITEEHIANAKAQITEQLATAQTPEQLVQLHGGMLIEYVADIKHQVKAMTLVNKVCNREITRITGNKTNLGYFAKDDIYAIVLRTVNSELENAEPTYEVVLSPFDTKTFRKVEFDVVSEIKSIVSSGNN